MAEGDDPRDPTTAAGMPPPWPIVDKRSTYQHPPMQSAPSYRPGEPPPSYGPPTGAPGRRSRRWLVALIVVVALALAIWLLLG